MPSFNRKTLFTLFFIILLTVVVTLLPGTIEQPLGELLKPVFGENYVAWIICIIILACVLLAILTNDFGKKQKQEPLSLSPEETQKNYETIRQYLLKKRYRPRLQQKLAGDQLFNLHVKPTKEGTSKEKADTFITLQGKRTGEEIRQIFEESRRRLLVTGVPGAGKTSLLLHLAIELLETETESLPVLLNLATWTSAYTTLDDWLREILPAELGVTKRYAAEILQKGQLTLLLDGLDEVAEEHRASCLQAIGEYGRLGRDYVISTRKDEYKALEKDAPVWAQIAVQPLTKTQLLAQLDKADRRDFPEAPDLKAALQHDPLLLQVAENPFYLNSLQLLFRGGNTLSDLKFSGATVEERQAEITERFVEQALAQPSQHGSGEQMRRWLRTLSFKLRHKVVFELTDIQYDWRRWSRMQLVLPKLVNGLVEGLIKGITGGLFIGLTLKLVLGLIGGVGFVLITGLQEKLFIHTRNVQWSLKLFYFRLKNKEIQPAIFFAFLLTGLAVVVFKFAGLVCAMGLWLYIFLAETYTDDIIQITTPYQRFTASAKALHFSILQHWLLRWQLYRAGVLPLRLVGFLNEMTARHLLETDGATWRLRHRILQEYFAGQWKENDAKNQ